MRTTDANDDKAAQWAIRLDSNDRLPPGEQAALDSWIEADPGRAGALLRAQAALAYIDRGRALAVGQVERAESRRTIVRWGFVGAAVAAGVVGLSVLSPSTQRFATGVGEVRRIPFADGSVAALNTRSRIAVRMEPALRNVALLDGEAWFQVAHDRKRPFLVEAGDVRVRAVGTAFSVRRHDDGGADILVTEGVVEAWREGSGSDRMRITAGERGFIPAVASATAALRLQPVAAEQEIERALAWRSGEMVLDGDTLDAAVAEINRYNKTQIVVVPALGREHLIGIFQTNDPARFAESAAAIVGGRAIAGPHMIMIGQKTGF